MISEFRLPRSGMAVLLKISVHLAIFLVSIAASAQDNFPEFQSQWLRAPSILEKYRLEKELLDKDGIDGFRAVVKKSEGCLAVVCHWAILKDELKSINPPEIQKARSKCREFLKTFFNETGLKPPVQWAGYMTAVALDVNGAYYVDWQKLNKLRDECVLISRDPVSLEINDVSLEVLTANDFKTNGYIKRYNDDGSLRWQSPIWATHTSEEGVNYSATGVASFPLWISLAIHKEDLIVWGVDSNGAWFMRFVLATGMQKDALLITW